MVEERDFCGAPVSVKIFNLFLFNQKKLPDSAMTVPEPNYDEIQDKNKARCRRKNCIFAVCYITEEK